MSGKEAVVTGPRAPAPNNQGGWEGQKSCSFVLRSAGAFAMLLLRWPNANVMHSLLTRSGGEDCHPDIDEELEKASELLYRFQVLIYIQVHLLLQVAGFRPLATYHPRG